MPEDRHVCVMDNYVPETTLTREVDFLVCRIEDHIYTKFWEHKFSACAFSNGMERAVHDELRRQLNLAYHHTDHRQAIKSLGTTVAWLRRLNPDAAASLAEGLEETLTVVRLGVPELLRKTLSTTNPIETAGLLPENWSM